MIERIGRNGVARSARFVLYLSCCLCLIAGFSLAVRAADPASLLQGYAGQDWPMWRCDAGRTASTDQELPAELHLQWIRHYPALEAMSSGARDTSNPKDKSVGFETVYLPIVLGAMMFVGSSLNHSVTAIDVETGEEKWKFYAGGPVRMAPAGWKDRVYVTSDDGFLYCLDAKEGKLLWKFRSAPMKHRILGDERLISAWPARGGPVVADGKVYFTASIFPFMGLYVYALDAGTGKPVWVNNKLGSKWGEGGDTTAPQGALAVVGNRLLLSNNGMSVTCLDRETGTYMHCSKIRKNVPSAKRRPRWRLCGAGKYYFAEGMPDARTHMHEGRSHMHNLETGRLIGGIPDIPVLADEVLYWAERTEEGASVGGSDLASVETSGPRHAPVVKIAELWRLDGIKAGAAESLLMGMKAGSRLYVTSGGHIVAVDIPTGKSKANVSWTGEVDGTVMEMLAAAGRLFAVTLEGGIHCFGTNVTTPRTHAVAHKEPTAAADAWTEKAGAILKSTGAKKGHALVLGIGSGRLMEELVKQSDLTVIGVDPDTAKVAAIRRRLDAAGLYGKRSQVIEGSPIDCGLPPYLAKLIVSEDPKAAGIEKGPAFAREVFRSLRPYGGAAYLPAAQVSPSTLKGWVESAKLEKAEIAQAGEFTLLTRVGALPGSAPWTHQNADAANTSSSRDDLVKGPLTLLWFGGPTTTLAFDRHSRAPRSHVVDGRMIIFGPNGLAAIDVYTGRILWQVSDPEIQAMVKPYLTIRGGAKSGGSRILNSNYVSLPDGIYVAGGSTCRRLDPATGKSLSEFTLPADGTMKEFGPIRIWEDVLIAAAGPIGQKKKRPFGANSGAGTHLVAFDRNNGKVLWSLEADQGFSYNGIAVCAGKVFCIDRWSIDQPLKSEIAGGKLLALDARTGKTIWRTDENVFGVWTACSPKTGVVLQGAGMLSHKNPNGLRGIAYRADDGKVLWDKDVGPGPWMLNGAMFITQERVAFDLRTGAEVKQFSKTRLGKGCDYQIGGTHLLTKRGWSAMYVDLDADTVNRLGGFRSGCTNTLIPANGVLSCAYFAGPCKCAINIRTSVALIHMPELKPETAAGK